MTQSGLEKVISLSTGIDEGTVTTVIDEMKSVILKNMAGGISIKLSGLGVFARTLRKQKKGVDFYHHKAMVIKKHYAPVFRFSKNIKNEMKGK